MPMPEAAIDEYYPSPAWKNDVGFTRQVGPMKPKTIAGAMQQATNDEFGLSIFRRDGSHDATA